MNRTKTVYKFIGTEEDAKKYRDPEPIVGNEYSDLAFKNILDCFANLNIELNWDHWKIITKSEPIPVHEVLTKMDRIKILKIFKPDIMWTLSDFENYIAFGTWPEK